MNVTFISNRKMVDAHVNAATARALEIMGGKAEGYAKQLCPVDTGRLRASITHTAYDVNTEIIGSNVSYAPFVELGTSRMSARPYLRPAAEGHADEYRTIWENELKRI